MKYRFYAMFKKEKKNNPIQNVYRVYMVIVFKEESLINEKKRKKKKKNKNKNKRGKIIRSRRIYKIV